MSKYFLKTDSGETYDLYITEDVSFSNPQSIIEYEAIKRRGGITIHMGAKTKTLTLSGKIYSNNDNNAIYEIKRKLEYLADSGEIINFISPIWDGKSNKYIIKDFNGNISSPSIINFDLSLIEYSQANIKKNAVNLVNFAPASNLIEILKSRGIIN